MKKSRLFLAIAISVVAFASCQKEQASVNNSGEKTVKFVAESIETKTAFGTPDGTSYPTLWTDNDSKVKISLNYGAPKDATITPSADYKSASFEAEIVDDESSEYTFYSVSPSTAYLGISEQNKSITIQVPNSQTPSASSVDETAQILVAKSDKYNSWPSEVDFSYSHVTAYGKMSFANLNLNGATVSSVSLTAKGEDGSDIGWVGRWYYYPDTKTFGNNSASATITINTASTTDIWFACIPVDLSGKQIEVTVSTTAGPFTKIITWPANKPFTSGKVFKFAVDMAGITPGGTKTYTKVTDKSELTVDSELIIVANNESFAMSKTQNTNNRGAASVTKTDDTIDNPSVDVQVFKAKVGNKPNTVAFYTGDSYICAPGGGNYLRSQSSIDDKASYTLEISDGKALLVAKDSEISQNIIRYNPNNNNPLFSCYGASSSVKGEVCLYKLNGSGTSTPIFVPVSKYILTISECEGGSISVSAGGQPIQTGAEVEEGTELTLTATPDGDLVLDAWNVTGADYTKYTVRDNQFVMPNQNVTISATFVTAGTSTTLDMTTKDHGIAAYNSSLDYDGWKIVNGANNNKGWEFFKMGGKSATLASANPCYIYNTDPISHEVKKLTVHIAEGSLSKSGMSVNSWGVYVYSDAKMIHQIDYVEGGNITSSAGDFIFTPSEGKTWTAGYYYKVSWNLANTTSTNGIICVDKITLSASAE